MQKVEFAYHSMIHIESIENASFFGVQHYGDRTGVLSDERGGRADVEYLGIYVG